MPSERSISGPRLKLGRYELIKELTGSGVAATWIARLEDGAGDGSRMFSILRLHKHVTKNVDGVEALLSEALRFQKLKHPNAISVVETGVADGEIFLVTEYVDAEPLASLVQQSGAAGLPAPVVRRIVSDVLAALEAAQAEELAHGEIHPQYVLVGVDGVARLSGFGIAAGLARLGNHGLKNLDRLGYAAPERVKAMASPASAASAPADARSDVFSAGVVLWELLAKQRLFPSKIEAAVIQKVLTAPIAALSSLPNADVDEALDALTQQMLERDPTKRPATIAEAAKALEAAGGLASVDDVKAIVEKLAGKTLATRRADVHAALRSPTIPPAGRGPSAPRARSATLLGIPAGGLYPGNLPTFEEKTKPAGTPRPAAVQETANGSTKAETPAPTKTEALKPEPPKPLTPKPGVAKPIAAKPVVKAAGSPEDKATADEPAARPLGKRVRAATLVGVMPASFDAPAPPSGSSDDLEVDVEDEVSVEAEPAEPAVAKRPPPPPAPKRPFPKPPSKLGAKPAAPKREETAPAAISVEEASASADAKAAPSPKPKDEPSAIDASPAAEPASSEPAAKAEIAAVAVAKDASPVLDSVPPTRIQPLVPSESAPGDASASDASKRADAAELSPTHGSDSGRGKIRGPAAQQIDRIGPGVTLGRYEILMPIAKGGMASVWAARTHGTRGFQKLVALKTMLPDVSDDPDFETMFLDEARVAARIRHPNVAEILDLGEQDDVLYIVMEWVEGETLGKLQKAAKSVGGFPVAILLRIASQCCAGLHAAHELRDDSGNLLDLVHRDISPANVLMSTSGYVKLVDFGIAKSKARLHVTQVGGMVKGKTPYLSPEQLGGLPVDRRSDLFSLGALLYVLATGLHPFRGDTEIKTIENIALRAPIPPRQIVASLPEDLEKIILKALEKDPASRYATAAEMQRAIDSLASSLGEPLTDDDLAAFVRKCIGASQDERAAKLKAAILAVDAATEANRQSAADDKPAPGGEGHADEGSAAPWDIASESEGGAAGGEPALDRDEAERGDDEPFLTPELARRRQMLKLTVGGVLAGLAILGGLAFAMHGGDTSGAAEPIATAAPTATPTAVAVAPTETAAPTSEPAPTSSVNAEAAAPSASASTEPAVATSVPAEPPPEKPATAKTTAPVKKTTTRTPHAPTHSSGTKTTQTKPKKYNPQGI